MVKVQLFRRVGEKLRKASTKAMQNTSPAYDSVHRLGLTPGLALDLRTGWDLTDLAQRAKMLSHFSSRKTTFDFWKLEWTRYQDDTHEVDD